MHLKVFVKLKKTKKCSANDIGYRIDRKGIKSSPFNWIGGGATSTTNISLNSKGKRYQYQ
jgi:hypothetical protein